MSILWTIIIGFVAGVIAKLLHPGPNEPSGFILTTILGIVGAFVATSRGPNKQIAPQQLEKALGPDVLETLSRHTGLSREELLSRLSKNLPEAVDKYTPEGRIPTATELG
jgi:uncharacterized membrane protein YeaQ/YmgE (transglycosylase-associated protein family)